MHYKTIDSRVYSTIYDKKSTNVHSALFSNSLLHQPQNWCL